MTQAHSDLLEEMVAELVAEGVVDFFEAVEIQHEQGHPASDLFGKRERLPYALEQQAAIGQACEVIHGCHCRQLGIAGRQFITCLPQPFTSTIKRPCCLCYLFLHSVKTGRHRANLITCMHNHGSDIYAGMRLVQVPRLECLHGS